MRVNGSGAVRLQRRSGYDDERGVAVPRHVDLGHDRDVARLRVGDDVRVLLLRVEPAVAAADLRLSADRREVRPRLDLDAPALVVGEVQMQPIDLVQRVQVDEPFDVLGLQKMAGDVEHRAAPLVSRHVDDVGRGHDQPPHVRRRMLDGRRQELSHRLHAVKQPRRLCRDDSDLRLRRRELVSLIAELRRVRRRWSARCSSRAPMRPAQAAAPAALSRDAMTLAAYVPIASTSALASASTNTTVRGVTRKLSARETSIEEGFGMTECANGRVAGDGPVAARPHAARTSARVNVE